MYDEWVFSTSLCCCAYVVQRQTWIWPISVRYAWFLATPSWFSLVYKLWSLNNKLPLYQKMKEPKLTHIRTEHMIKNKLEKIIKARLQKNTQLVVTGEWKTCLYCTWNHLPRNKNCEVINIWGLKFKPESRWSDVPPNVHAACIRNQIDHGNDLFTAVHTKAFWLPKVVIPQSFVLLQYAKSVNKWKLANAGSRTEYKLVPLLA